MGSDAAKQSSNGPAPGDVIAGKYEVERVLASGGMGVVVSARHRQLRQRVALKFLLPEAAELSEYADRFLREARAAVALRGEHVVRVLDVGTLDDGQPFMVMEHLEGHDLREELARRGPLPFDEVIAYVLQACEALAEAHALGIVHRDIKPSNLFKATRPDGSPLIKVVDFGISKRLSGEAVEDPKLTSTRALLGSPHYMAPEQVRDPRSVDHRADIWALGVTLHELCTDDTPFTGESVPAISAAIVADAPIPLRRQRPDAPEALERVIATCLEKSAAARYQSIAELAAALGDVAPATALASVSRAADIARHSRPDGLRPPDIALRMAEASNPEADTVAAGDAMAPSHRSAEARHAVTAYAAGDVAARTTSRGRRGLFALVALIGLASITAAVAVGRRSSDPTHDVAASPAPPAEARSAPASETPTSLAAAARNTVAPPEATSMAADAAAAANEAEASPPVKASTARKARLTVRAPNAAAQTSPATAQKTAPAPKPPATASPKHDPLSDRK